MEGVSAEAGCVNRTNVAEGAAALAAFIGALVYAGWQLQVPIATAWVPGAAAAHPGAALGIFFLGIASFTARRERSRVRRILIAFASLPPLLLGVFTLAEYAFHGPVGVGPAFASSLGITGSMPGRISAIAALCLVFLSIATPVSSDARRPLRRSAIALATVATFLCLVSLLGYLYGFAELGLALEATQVSLPTALGLAFIGGSILVRTAEDGWLRLFLLDSPASRHARRLVVAAILIPIVVVWLGHLSDWITLFPAGVGDAFVVLTTASLAVFVLWWTTRELQAAHDELVDLKRGLERRVGERTRQLEETNRELEAFNYSVSHDLRNPLHIVSGFTQRLATEKAARLDAEGRGYLKEIRLAAGRMKDITDALLRLGRLSKLPLRTTTVDLGFLAHDIARRLQAREPGRGVRFNVVGEVACHGDPELLGIVMENLLSNAWKFTRRAADPLIELGGRRTPVGTVFYVRDNGVGFDPEEARFLFTPFRRLHAGDDFEGTGVGLATVARIVQRHGGRVYARGAAGKGATFYFTLPDPPAPKAVAHPAAAPTSGPAPSSSAGVATFPGS